IPNAYYIRLAAYDGREAKRTECRGSTRSLQQTATATADRRLFHGFSWWMDGTLGTRPGRAGAFDSRVLIIQTPLPCPAVTLSRRPAGRLMVAAPSMLRRQHAIALHLRDEPRATQAFCYFVRHIAVAGEFVWRTGVVE